MHGDSVGILYWLIDVDDPSILMGAPLHGSTREAILRNPVQIPPGCHPGGSLIPHYLKYGGGCSNYSLGHSGSSIEGGNGRFWTGDPVAGNVILL